MAHQSLEGQPSRPGQDLQAAGVEAVDRRRRTLVTEGCAQADILVQDLESCRAVALRALHLQDSEQLVGQRWRRWRLPAHADHHR